MNIMLAYDGSRNAKLALAQAIAMFRNLEPQMRLVAVAENPRDITDANDDMFQEEWHNLDKHLDEAIAFARNEGIETVKTLVEGDPRKMLWRATQKFNPDLLVIARHSHQPDGGIIANSLTYFVDELDYMTFGSVSSFLARRVECPLLIFPSP
jgi:nucleotide-binding universal stress UspA family protein